MNYSYTIKFPRTEIKTEVSKENEVSISKQGHYTYNVGLAVKVFSKDVVAPLDRTGRKTVDYSESIGETSIIKDAEGQLFAKYKRSFYPLDCFVCSYVAQPCIYV